MKLITREGRAAEVWEAVRRNHGGAPGSLMRHVYPILAALGRAPTADEIEAAYRSFPGGGARYENYSLDETCDQCRARFPAVVTVGDEPDHDARYADLCRDCLLAALQLLCAGDPLKEFALAVLAGDRQACDAARDVLRL